MVTLTGGFKVYDAKFFISSFGRAFKVMKNTVYFIVIAFLLCLLSSSRFWFKQIR